MPNPRQLVVLLAAIALSACAAQPDHLPSEGPDNRDNEPLDLDEGAVMLELIHAPGAAGPQMERWTRVTVASIMEVDDSEPPTYTLERLVDLGGRSAVFGGRLPVGGYRIVSFEGEQIALQFHRLVVVPYKVPAPEKPGEFFVAGGKLNSLGVMMQASVGDWSWVTQEEPSYDMAGLVRRLRPELAWLDSPDVMPQELRKVAEPPSRIQYAYPTTPLLVLGDTVLLGAQRGTIYRRSMVAGTAKWEAFDSGSRQGIRELLSTDGGTVLALLVTGEVLEFDPDNGSFHKYPMSVPGRIVSLGQVDGRLHAVAEDHLSSGSNEQGRLRLRVYRQAGDSAAEWQRIGHETIVKNTPGSVQFRGNEALIVHKGPTWRRNLMGEMWLERIPLADLEVTREEVDFFTIRELNDGTLAAARGPRQLAANYFVSDDNGASWRSLAEIEPFGWPLKDVNGSLVVPGDNPVYRGGEPGKHLLRFVHRRRPLKDIWKVVAEFPMHCSGQYEAAFVQDTYLALCGDRVFSLQSPETGWNKEALHEGQSSLP